ncbi:hypothetical protein O0I10_006544 [Lichtheimia ornata]|uniref:Ribosome assembly protein 3 n=1 Tax=Lichtheimia ornata TaxID=688661 RepID=A0AAD7V1R6_9FUNG|nr:uncharacterized protein O0I10_006544 [Lichtheimia ornata]KAJ8657729.1 hypothetical protein O0I10_006544 [Lichtheimia ornata]
MAKAGRKRQQKNAPAHSNKKPKRVPEDDNATEPDREIEDNQDHELEVEALLDDFEQQVKSSALEEAIREMKEGSASDSDSTDNEEEDENEAMSEDERPADDGNMDVDDEERIPDTKSEDKPSTFRDRYMGKVTQAFSTDLDKIRQEPNFDASQLTLLIDSLEAGIDIFSDLEKEIVMRQ